MRANQIFLKLAYSVNFEHYKLPLDSLWLRLTCKSSCNVEDSSVARKSLQFSMLSIFLLYDDFYFFFWKKRKEIELFFSWRSSESKLVKWPTRVATFVRDRQSNQTTMKDYMLRKWPALVFQLL